MLELGALNPDRHIELGQGRVRLRDHDRVQAGGGKRIERVGDQRPASELDGRLGSAKPSGEPTGQYDA